MMLRRGGYEQRADVYAAVPPSDHPDLIDRLIQRYASGLSPTSDWGPGSSRPNGWAPGARQWLSARRRERDNPITSHLVIKGQSDSG